MKKIILMWLLTVSLLGLGSWAGAYDFTVEGYLLYRGAPFGGASVVFYAESSPDGIEVASDANGFYSHTFEIPDGTSQSIQLQSIDYCSGVAQVQLLVSYDGVLSLDLELCNGSTYNECQAGFFYYQENPANFLQFSFFNYSFGVSPVTAYSWDFGDGTASTEPDPVHIYSQAGEYTVTLAITTEGGCSSAYTQGLQAFNIWGGCFANFSYAETPADSMSLQFTDLSQGDIVSWNWDFGDGSTSIEQNPIHTFAEPGYYLVALAIYTADDCYNYSCNYICVGECSWGGWEECYAGFSNQADPADSLTMIFTDQSFSWNGMVNSWFWDFGDGTAGEGQSPVHHYDSAGVYTVTLTITTGQGCRSAAAYPVWVGAAPCVCPDYYDPVCVTLPDGTITQFENSCWAICSGFPDYYYCDGQSCGASFWSYPAEPGGLTLQFQDGSWGDVNSWLWDFGDGTFGTGPSPQHTYAEPGVYVVSLTIQAADSCNSMVKYEVYVGETIFQGGCQAFFWFEQNTGDPLTFQFVDESFGDFIAQTWDFGDGNTTTDPNPAHTYALEGNYIVTLTGITADGCSSSYSMNLLSTPEAYYSDECQALFVPVINGLNVGFYDVSWGNAVAHAWDFGDGTSSSEAFAGKIYSQEGIYRVTLSITTDNGCTSRFSTIINLAEGVIRGDAGSAAILVNTSPGLKQFQGLSLAPNPAREQVSLIFTQPVDGEVFVSVISMNGQEAWREKVLVTSSAQRIELPLNGLAPGFYIVKASSSAGSKALKLIKG